MLLLGLLFLSSHVQACYYSALNLENPTDYYYRYCKVGCHGMQPAQAVFDACCTPLALGATAPSTCQAAMTSPVECKWGDVPTSDFPTSTYIYQPSPTSSSAPPVITSSGKLSEVTSSEHPSPDSSDCTTSTTSPVSSVFSGKLAQPTSSPTPISSSKTTETSSKTTEHDEPSSQSTTSPPPASSTSTSCETITTMTTRTKTCWCDHGTVTTCDDHTGRYYTW